MSEAGSGRARDDASIPELITGLAEQTSRLVRDEIRLAQAELMEKGKHAARGAGLLGGAGLLSFFGFALLLRAATAALGRVMPQWASALTVSGVLFGGAGIAGLAGWKELKKGGTPLPEATIESIKQGVEDIKEQGLS